MKYTLLKWTRMALSLSIFGNCLLVGHGAFAEDQNRDIQTTRSSKVNILHKLEESEIKPLIKLKDYDFKSMTDLKSLQLKLIQVKEKMGPGSGGGGNQCSLMILANTQALLTKIKEDKIFGTNLNIAKSLEDGIKRTRIYFGENLIINGNVVDAINYPSDGALVIDKNFCKKIDSVSISSMGLLLHEYLAMAQIEDKNYQISSAFVNELKRRNYSPRVVDGEVFVTNLDNLELEVKSDIFINANSPSFVGDKLYNQYDQPTPNQYNYGFYKVYGYLEIDTKSYDRVLRTPRTIRIKQTKFGKMEYNEETNTCDNGAELILDHPEIKRLVLRREFKVDSEDDCYVYGMFHKVKHFYQVFGRYFLIKAKAPVDI